MNRKTDSGGPADNLDGFLSLSWHGAHTEEGSAGKDPDVYVNLDISRDCIGGQFELYFCSTDCLRIFLNRCVDELETQVCEAKEKTQT